MSSDRSADDGPPDKALTDLGWGQLLAHLGQRAHTERGAAAARELALCHSPAAATARSQQIGELRGLYAAAAAPPFGGITDVRTPVARAEKGGMLDAEQLLAVARAAEGCHRLARHFHRHASDAPGVAALAEAIVDLTHVYRPIADSFDADGQLADHASDELGPLRRKVASLKAKLDRAAQKLVDDPRIQKHLQDSYYTQRDDRYVVPVKVESRAWVKGIVHGTSQSGATLFIEPDTIVDLNNNLKLAECEVLDEERRIMAQLTGYVAEEAGAIRDALAVATELDVLAAAARLADDMAASPAAIDDSGRLELLRARHPLMIAAGRHCVANDIVLAPRSVLVISGPNAGGKTVALKTAGLAALMTRAGLHLPVADGSRVPWFSRVLCDIGDAQSIEMDLSTFSGHLLQLREVLAVADADTLVLVDEIAVGTEPEQGAALARAVLETLADRGVTTIVTTHYEALKALAASDARFENASVGFDLEKMEPTFVLHTGAPGSSGALRVGRRMGLPADVLARAETILGDSRSGVEEILASLEAARRELEEERAQTAEVRAEAERALREARAATAAADERRKKLHQGLYDEALESLRKARDEADAVRKRIRKRVPAPSPAERERKELAELSSQVAEHRPARAEPPGRAVRVDELAVGARVFVVPLGGEGAVVAAPNRGKVQVQVGPLKTTADISDLRLLGAAAKKPAPATRPAASKPRRRPAPTGEAGQTGESGAGETDEPVYARTDDVTVDVRGERADDATARVDQFIDQCLRASRDCIFIIHGHGTGALRRAVRELLASHPAVDRFRAAPPNQGGDGVTVAFLDVA